MKLLVLSDTHRYLKNAENILLKIGSKMSGVIHLGDHDDDAKQLQIQFADLPFYYVKGNNDYGTKTPSEQLLHFHKKAILIVHGHKQQVYWSYDTIRYWAEEKGADAVLFGHTHTPLNDSSDKILLFNPGSISLPRGTSNPTFGIIDISQEGIISGSIMAYCDKDTFMRLG